MTVLSRILGVLRSVAAVAVVLVLAQQLASAQGAGPDLKRLRMMTTSDVQIGGPWFVAIGKDFFKAEGFENVEVLQFPSAPPGVSGVH